MPFNPNTAKPGKFNPATAKPKMKPSEQRAMQAAQARAAAGHDENAFLQSLGSIANGASFGLLNTIDAGKVKLQTQVENLIRDAQGKPQRFSSDEAYRATKALEDKQSAEFAKTHPVTNFTGNLMGGIIAPGVGKASQWASEAPTLFGQVLRGAAVGGATGAAYGAGSAQDGQRLKGAESGALTGAAIGGTLPVVAAGVKTVAAPAARTANKVVNSMTGGKVNLLNPQREAMKSVAAALKRDGATPEQARQITNEWLKSGASSPSLMDMASKLPSGGQATIGLVRGAALPAGPARGAAIQYADQVASDLQGNAIGHARNLVPGETRSIPQIEEALQGTRAANANQNYAPLYQTPVNASDDVLSALADPQGASAVQNAIQAAVANRDYAKAGELQSLLDHASPKAKTYNHLASGDVRGATKTFVSEINSALDQVGARSRINQSDILGGKSVGGTSHYITVPFDHYDANGVPKRFTQQVRISDHGLGARRSGMENSIQTDADLADQIKYYTDIIRKRPEFIRGAPKPTSFDDIFRGPKISAGALEEVRQALRDAGAAMSTNPSAPVFNRRAGMGLQSRASSLNDVLSQVPEIQPARADYANISNQLDALGEGALAANPAQNPAQLQQMIQQRVGAAQPVGQIPATEAENAIRQSMQVGGARQMESQIGAAPEGALGYLKRLGTSTNAGQNLESLYGPDKSQLFRDAINNERLRVQNAQSINPMSGSRTAVNASDTLDANVVGSAASALHGNFGPLLSKLISNPTLTDQEREQIVRLVLGQAQIPQVANANGSVISPYATGLAVQQQNRNGNQ